MSWITLTSVAERIAEEQFFWCQKQALKLPITVQEVAGILRIALGDREIAELLLRIWTSTFAVEGSARALMHAYLWAYARKPNPKAHERWLRSSPRNIEIDITWLVLAADCRDEYAVAQ